MAVMEPRKGHRKTKLQLYKTLVLTLISYESEGWSLTEKSCNVLDIFEREDVAQDVWICDQRRNLEGSEP